MMAGHSLLGAAEESLSSEEEICGNIMGLMLHGISTSANLIGNILTRLVVFPKLQDQVQIGSFIFQCCKLFWLCSCDELLLVLSCPC
jgi:hypothetical protein